MLTNAHGRPMELSSTQVMTRNAGGLLTRKIWLPKILYDALPWFYLASGVLAFLATLHISAWYWVVPHYVIFSGACIHLGFVVRRRRKRRPLPE